MHLEPFVLMVSNNVMLSINIWNYTFKLIAWYSGSHWKF